MNTKPKTLVTLANVAVVVQLLVVEQARRLWAKWGRGCSAAQRTGIRLGAADLNCHACPLTQIYSIVMYDLLQMKLIARFPRAAWLRSRGPCAGDDDKSAAAATPSWACMELIRVPYMVAITALAAAFPFFAQILGLVGAVGLTPLCFTYPFGLHAIAFGRGKTLGAHALYWGHIFCALLCSLVGSLAAVGATYALVVAIKNGALFS